MIIHQQIQEVTWDCVHFLGKGEWESEVLSHRQELEEKGIALCEMRLAGTHSKMDLLDAVAEAMKFPNYFGRNWDALHDCLKDMDDWLPAKGYVLTIHKAAEMWRDPSQVAGTFLGVWLSAAEFWGKQNIPFHLIFIL